MLSCPCRGGAELVSIGVDPAVRRRGTASALMNSTRRRLKRNGINRLKLMVRVTNQGALRFYEKYGFTTVKIVPGYYEDGTDGWLMVG
jgi:ribosomal-protein-alanine N-acetyltransferase